MELQGQKALVTGASRGIGAAIALELARAGAEVALLARTVEGLEASAAAIREAGGTAQGWAADVGDAAQFEAAIGEAHKQMGRLDILVNNAGITRDRLIIQMKDDDWDQVLQVNLRSAFVACKAAAKIMLRQKSGRIIQISSVIGVIGNAGQSNYAASKAGTIGLVKSLAKELASRSITVNAVAPGYIETDMTSVLPDKVREQILSQIPLGRIGSAGDIAPLVRFLAGPGSSYITGQVFHVDGGMVT
ncbi:MAG: 3-oxoacyl-[acyl-carrier-protein] reductase [Candidatus Eremiobacteraeota bacterium]|nr:3-oxoacyl-[acyl-carrier-protein] reductase [Candidatus Eremiobacteraeota bacterium]MCW5870922.1 3-oxoacyl-[acyl-carrier-protein] reductase [Candidatus Eremiobacteraeota bacterium]